MLRHIMSYHIDAFFPRMLHQLRRWRQRKTNEKGAGRGAGRGGVIGVGFSRHKGVSENNDTPKMDIYNGKPY